MLRISLALLPIFAVTPGIGGAVDRQNISDWRSSPQASLQYRVKCRGNATSIEWRNGYPGEVTFKARVSSATFEGSDDLAIDPAATRTSHLDTMYCSPESYQVTIAQFEMKPPPTAAARPADDSPAPVDPPRPLIPRYVPPGKLPEIAPEALASVRVGMRQLDVVRRLGPPEFRIAIPEETELVETCRYRLSQNRLAVIRFSNGVVAEIRGPESQGRLE